MFSAPGATGRGA
jgi:hypothetical protein